MHQPSVISRVIDGEVDGEVAHTTMATSQKFHRQPLAAVRNPPIIGPTQGPIAARLLGMIILQSWIESH